MFRIEPTETPETAVKRIAGERLDLVINLLTRPDDDFDKAVHTARKNLKRIRALLRLVRDEIGDETYRRENACYRDAGRRLAPLRDSAVMVMTLDAIRAHCQTPDAFAATRSQLAARQTAIRRQFGADADVTAETAASLRQAKRRFMALPITQADFGAFYGGLHRVYRRGRRRMALAYADPAAQPERFHDWRKRVKYLWYHLEILEPLWPPVFQEWVRELHHISDLLGDAHDFMALHDLLISEPEMFTDKAELAGLLPLLAERRRELEEMARPYGRRLYAEKAAAFSQRIAVLWDVWHTAGIGGLPPAPLTLKEGDLVSTATAGQQLGISPRQVRHRIHAGQLPAIKIGRNWAIPSGATHLKVRRA